MLIIVNEYDQEIPQSQTADNPEITKQVPRTIPLYKKANCGQLKQSMRDLHSELKQSDLATTSAQSMWDKLANKFEQGL